MNYLINTLDTKGVDSHFKEGPVLALTTKLFVYATVNANTTRSFAFFGVFELVNKFTVNVTSDLSPVCVTRVTPTRLHKHFISVGRLAIMLNVLTSRVMG